MRPDYVGLGGFDSHALPPRRGRRVAHLLRCAAVPLLIAGASGTALAQQATAVRAGVVDSSRAPLSPGKAFLYSLVIPGLAQAKLDRPIVGAGFFLVEAVAIALIRRTGDDLRLAKAFSRDSVPLRYSINTATGTPSTDANGNPVVAEWAPASYSAELVRARQLQLEDWTAILIFNHLISGAEAFVAAQLWDFPQHVKMRATPVPGGYGLGFEFKTR